VIALTAHVQKSDRDEALAAGCNNYDSKPIDFSRLLEKIEKQFVAKKKHHSKII
jgi:CheY-like chemotaxis protein